MGLDGLDPAVLVEPAAVVDLVEHPARLVVQVEDDGGGGGEEPARAEVGDVPVQLDLVERHERGRLAEHPQVVGGDLRQAEAGQVLVAEQVCVHLVRGGQDACRVGRGLTVLLDEVERELLDRALGRLVHVQELGLDQLPVGDEPGVRLEAEEVLRRVDRDVPAVDLDAGQAAPARVERLGQLDRDGRGVDGGHRVSVSDWPGSGTGMPEPGVGVRNFGVPPGPRGSLDHGRAVPGGC